MFAQPLPSMAASWSAATGAISVGKLEAFVADQARAPALGIPVPEIKTGKRVAVWSGPACGITVAEDLIKQGATTSPFTEAWPVAGSVLVYGIPNFKLDKRVVMNKIRDLEEAGRTNHHQHPDR